MDVVELLVVASCSLGLAKGCKGCVRCWELGPPFKKWPKRYNDSSRWAGLALALSHLRGQRFA